jgi:acyl dehydratase
MEAWSTRAVNLVEHADNPVHTDAGARAAGYPAAIVAGTTVYAYLCHPPFAAWGDRWLAAGGGEVHFHRPVFADDLVDCVPDDDGDIAWVEARVGGELRARFAAWEEAPAVVVRSGTELAGIDTELVEAYADYGLRVGDDEVEFSRRGIAHPATWIALANRIFLANLVDGAWVHTRSRVHHRAIAPIGAPVRVAATLVDTFSTRAGERAVVDVVIHVDGSVAAIVEHEALIRLA